jgi:hypothetical protein
MKNYFVPSMEEQISPSIPPQSQPPFPPELSVDFVEQLKARAREEAIRQTMLQKQNARQELVQPPAPTTSAPINFGAVKPEVVYVRRNLTVAELIVVFAIACGLVTGVQATWHFGSRLLSNIEIRVK